jgi:cob(I)alamin adenosyltransferase
MNQPAARKLEWLSGYLDDFERMFEVVPLGHHAESLRAVPGLPLHAPRFATRRSERSASTLGANEPSQQQDAR